MSSPPDFEDRVDANPAILKAMVVTISQSRTFVGEVFGADGADLEANIQAMATQASLIRKLEPDYLLFVGTPEDC